MSIHPPLGERKRERERERKREREREREIVPACSVPKCVRHENGLRVCLVEAGPLRNNEDVVQMVVPISKWILAK
jgi:hypothetical protein